MNQKGFANLIILIIALAALAGIGGYFVWNRQASLPNPTPTPTPTPIPTSTPTPHSIQNPNPSITPVPAPKLPVRSQNPKNIPQSFAPKEATTNFDFASFCSKPENKSICKSYGWPDAATKETGLNSKGVSWDFDFYGSKTWKASGNPPACPNPLIFQTPVDLSRATSILYPGQYRGTEYKPHGGFRFDTSRSDEITVRAPMDAVVFRGSQYPANGEIQYAFDFIAPCGIMYRFAHLRVLSPKFAQIAAGFPAPKELDSRATYVSPPVSVTAGEVIATAVGLFNTKNVFLDWGVYDLRKRNAASEDPLWASKREGEQAPYAVCWFDWLPAPDAAKVRSLPGADGVNGTKSDYCE